MTLIKKNQKRPRITPQEQVCLAALLKLQKEWGDERPPLNEIAGEIDVHISTASNLLKSLSLKGYVKETWEVFA